MHKTLTIAYKELKTYFQSPAAYIVLILTLSIFHIFFFMIIDQDREATLRDVFKVIEFLLVFIVPILTMKTFAEEKQMGTMEFLMTTPTTPGAIVIGKYLGSLFFLTILLAFTLIYYFIIEFFGSPDRTAILSGYIGLWLEGAFFIAVGILASSWTSNPLIAAITSYVILLTLYFSIGFIKYFNGFTENIIRYLGPWSHLENLSAGLMTLSDIVYFVSGIFLSVTLARLSVERNKKWQFSFFLAALYTLLVIQINFCTVYWWNLRLDLTKAKQHTLSPKTVHVLSYLNGEVRLSALHVGIPPKYLEDLFKEYERYAKGNIKTEIIDPLVNIGYAAQFGNLISGQESKVVIRSNNERRDIDFSERPLLEQDLTNAILNVTRKSRHIYFLTGHGEYSPFALEEKGLSILTKLLSDHNIQVETLMLGISNGIPADCDLLVAAGPKDFLTPQEERFIQDYLYRGGDALFLIEHTLVTTPDIPLTEEQLQKNPSLNSILNEWGIKIADDVVVDLSSHVGEDVGCPATQNYMPFKAVTHNLDYIFFIRPRSIAMIKERKKSLILLPLILTASDSQSSWGETNRTLQVKFDEDLDRPGPIPVAFLIQEPKDEHKASETRIAVFTDCDFLSNAYISHYSNAQLGLNVIHWLTQIQEEIFIDPKEIKVERLDLTSRQKRQVGMILLAFPFFIGIFGVVGWVKTMR